LLRPLRSGFETQGKAYILGAYKILILYATKYPGEHAPAWSTVEELFKKEGYTGRKKRKTGYRHGWRRKRRTMCGRLISKGGGGRGVERNVCR
jgi:hypothetical protein